MNDDRLIQEFLKHSFSRLRTLNTTIHSDDEMLLFLLNAEGYQGRKDKATLAYFKSAAEIVDRVNQVVRWKFKSWKNIDRFFEFACGYGRLTRFWVNKMNPEKIWAADIYTEAVDFVSEEFRVHGIYSAIDPQDYNGQEKFNCIVVYSLFSHLPEHRFYQWLETLYNLLLPDGILLFSVHDRAVQPREYSMPESGILFVEQSESQSLDTAEYGSSWVTEAFVKQAIAQSSNQQASYTRIPRAFTLQDLYIVTKEPKQDFSDLNINLTPKGTLEEQRIDDQGRIFLRGWTAIIQADHNIEEVQIWIVGQLTGPDRLIQRCIPTSPSAQAAQVLGIEAELTQKSGFCCAFSLPEYLDLETGIILIKAVSDRQKERIVDLNWIKDWLTAPLSPPQLIPQSWKSRIISQLNWWRAKIFDNIWCGNIQGNLDRATIKTNSATEQTYWELEGWSISLDSDLTIIDIQIWINDSLVQRCLPSCSRPDVAQYWGNSAYLYSGWIVECYQPPGKKLKSDRLQIKVIDSEQEDHILYDDILVNLLSKSAGKH